MGASAVIVSSGGRSSLQCAERSAERMRACTHHTCAGLYCRRSNSLSIFARLSRRGLHLNNGAWHHQSGGLTHTSCRLRHRSIWMAENCGEFFEEGLRFIESIESNIGGQQSERQLQSPAPVHKFPPPEVPNSSAPAPHLPRRYVRHPFTAVWC